MILLKNRKWFLFVDTVLRFNIKQIFALIRDRLNKKLWYTFKRLEYNKLTENEKAKFIIFKASCQGSFFQNKLNTEYMVYYHFYHKKLLDTNLENTDYSQLWLKSNNFELDNNYQRFHLFNIMFLNNQNDQKQIIKLIVSWIKNHEEIKGSPWNGFNCSMRIVNWVKLLSLLRIDFDISNKTWVLIENSICQQAQHINNNIEHHIPGNHVILQYFSLLLVFENFPKWNFSVKNNKNIRQKFFAEIENEYLNNGLHFEQSYHYHLQITIMCLIWMDMEVKSKRRVSEKIIDIITKAVSVVEKFRFSNDYLPMIGDNCFNFFNPTLHDDFEHILTFKKSLGLLSPREQEKLTLENQYQIVKIKKEELIFDIGNIGLKYNPGHGHSDLSNFIYISHGTTLFVDPGTRQYSNTEEDLQLKKSKSHNTISINSEDQAKLWGFFRWAYLPKNISNTYNQSEDEIKLSNEYLGFINIGGYKHYREISLKDGRLNIIDKVFGNSNCDISISFILNHDIKIERENNIIKLKKYNHIWIVSSAQTDIIKVGKQYVYPNYDVPYMSKRIEFKFNSVNLPFENNLSVEYKR